MDRHGYLSVNDLMNHSYCGRITWYAYVLGVKQRGTVKTEHGRDAHEQWAQRERNRWKEGASIKARAKLQSAEITSERLRLRGKVDALVGADGSIVPYEVKTTAPPEHPWPEQRLQLAAYALLLEERHHRPVDHGYFHYLEGDVVREWPITEAAKQLVRDVIADMTRVVESEAMPLRAAPAKCLDCVYGKICI